MRTPQESLEMFGTGWPIILKCSAIKHDSRESAPAHSCPFNCKKHHGPQPLQLRQLVSSVTPQSQVSHQTLPATQSLPFRSKHRVAHCHDETVLARTSDPSWRIWQVAQETGS